MSERRILTHFTNAEGVHGITGLDPESLIVGEEVIISVITFGVGQNTQFARNDGDIFITELRPDASSGQLVMIGVSGDKQQFAIRFDAEDAFNSGVMIYAGREERSIFVIPANSVITGEIQVVKRF
jgi:hypothetical protein